MNIEELIKHLENLKNVGYTDYNIKVRNSYGNFNSLTSFIVDTENNEIRLL